MKDKKLFLPLRLTNKAQKELVSNNDFWMVARLMFLGQMFEKAQALKERTKKVLDLCIIEDNLHLDAFDFD